MSAFIIIRYYKVNDALTINEVVREAYVTNVKNAWFNAITKEITFQLIVMVSAIMFIFIGLPLFYCLASIPFVLLVIYFIVYSSFLMKATELTHSKKPLQCWVAEACEPFLFLQKPQNVSYKILTDKEASKENIDLGTLQRKVIGTVAVSKHLHSEDSAWLFRLAVHANYRRKGIGHALIRNAQNWCHNKRYNNLELAMSECQENVRQVFVDTGFEMRQMYHKQLLGNALTLLMYQLGCDLNKMKHNIEVV